VESTGSFAVGTLPSSLKGSIYWSISSPSSEALAVIGIMLAVIVFESYDALNSIQAVDVGLWDLLHTTVLLNVSISPRSS
jgi:hypothetical protein